MVELLNGCAKVGIEVFLVVGVFAMLFYIVKELVLKVITLCDKMIDRLDKHEAEANKRGEFVRKEHQLMIESLGRINGYKEHN